MKNQLSSPIIKSEAIEVLLKMLFGANSNDKCELYREEFVDWVTNDGGNNNLVPSEQIRLVKQNNQKSCKGCGKDHSLKESEAKIRMNSCDHLFRIVSGPGNNIVPFFRLLII